MNAADRQTIRAAINVAARERVQESPIAYRCATCRCARDDRTVGCATCSNRHRGREKRATRPMKQRRP